MKDHGLLSILVLPLLLLSAPNLVARRDFPAGGRSATAIAAADFDQDGTLDLAVTLAGQRSLHTPMGRDEVVLLLGKTDSPGTFDLPEDEHRFPVGFPPTSPGDPEDDDDPVAVVQALLDAGRFPDLVTVNFSDASITVVLNPGDPDTRELMHLSTPPYPRVITVGHLDDDDHLDLAVGCGECPDFDPALPDDPLCPLQFAAVRIFLSFPGHPGRFFPETPDLVFDGTHDPDGGGRDIRGIGTWDLDDDGRDDDLVVLTHRQGRTNNVESRLRFLRRRGQQPGFNVQPQTVDVGNRATDLVIADVFGVHPGPEFLVALGHHRETSLTVVYRSATGPPFRVDSIPARGSIRALDVGDVDGDGSLDALLVHATNTWKRELSSSLTLLRGDGASRFRPATARTFHTGLHPLDLTVADLDGDGRLDVAVPASFLQDSSTRPEPALVSIHRNRGGVGVDAGFVDTVDTTIDRFANRVDGARRVSLGHVNPPVPGRDAGSDAILDAIVVSHGTGSVIVSPGLGDGRFAHDPAGDLPRVAVTLGGGRQPRDLTVGDLDGDGDNDIATANTLQRGFTLLRNHWSEDGELAFVQHHRPAHPHLPHHDTRCVLLSSLGRDGEAFLVVGVQQEHPLASRENPLSPRGYGVQVYRWLEDSCVGPVCDLDHLTLLQEIEVDTSPHDLEAADLDGDGAHDLAVALRAETEEGIPMNDECDIGSEAEDRGGLAILWGDPGWDPFSGGEPFLEGAMATRIRHDLFLDPRSLAVADLVPETPGPDLATVSHCMDYLFVFENLGGREFTLHEKHPLASWPNSIEAADLDGNGFPDLAAACYHSNTVAVLLAREEEAPDGTRFIAPFFLGVGNQNYGLDIGNVDGPSHAAFGRPDIVTVGQDSDDLSTILNRRIVERDELEGIR